MNFFTRIWKKKRDIIKVCGMKEGWRIIADLWKEKTTWLFLNASPSNDHLK